MPFFYLPIQMGRCPVIRGGGVMADNRAVAHDPSVGDYADTSPYEWGGC